MNHALRYEFIFLAVYIICDARKIDYNAISEMGIPFHSIDWDWIDEEIFDVVDADMIRVNDLLHEYAMNIFYARG